MSIGSKKINILIVDDIELNLMVMKQALQNDNWNLLLAKNGADALKLYTENHVDLILTDIQMPDLNGLQLVEQIKLMKKNEHLSIILVTANKLNDEYIKTGYEIGASDFFHKPFNKILLYRKVELLLNLKKQRRQIELQKSLLEVKNKELEEQYLHISKSISCARDVQKNALSGTQDLQNELSKFALVYAPKDVLSGDFFWVDNCNGKLYVAVADCTGHGVAGALLTIEFNRILEQAVNEMKYTCPADILNYAHDKAVERLGRKDGSVDGMDIAICVIDKSNHTITYAGAHNDVLVVRNNELLQLKVSNRPIGFFSEKNMFEPFTSQTFDFQKGDRVYLYSDGFMDQFHHTTREKFGRQQFENMIKGFSNVPMEDQRKLFEENLLKWKGFAGIQIDDICVLGFELN